MRVLIDCSHVATGGAIQNSIALLHNAPKTVSHEWHVIMTGALSKQVPREADRSFASVRRLDQWSGFRTRYFVHWAMPSWERAIRPDVSYAPGGPVYWRAACRQIVAFAVPHLIYPEYDATRGLDRLQYLRMKMVLAAAARSFRQADLLVVQTETVRERVSKLLPFPRERIYLVKNSFSPAFARGVEVGKPGKRTSSRRIVFVPSAYYVHKNLEIVVEVARQLRRRSFDDVEFRFTLPHRSTEWKDMESRAQELSVRDMIVTVGSVPHSDLAQHYLDADAVLLPTLLECSTAVYPESFVSGTPLITSDLDFARELCGGGAIFVDPFDPTGMADSVVEVLTNPETRQRLIDNGRRALAENYTTPDAKWRSQLECIEGI